MRQLVWKTMTNADKAWVHQRGTAAESADELKPAIRALVDDVRTRGDAALLDALARFDHVEIDASGIAVSDEEFDHAIVQIDPGVHQAIKQMIGNIQAFNEALHERRQSWTAEISPGHTVGEKVGPIANAALFCPSGKASYPSVLAQIATPAVVAGVPQLSVIVPPAPGANGAVDDAVLVVAHELGLSNVYRVNGPAGIAAAAFGTETIPAHGMIIGPGSPPVALAQLEVRAHGVDTVVLGPTESMVIADESADPVLLAADLLNEAEHGTDSTVVLVSAEQSVIDAAAREVARQGALLPEVRREAAASALSTNGGAILVESLGEAIEVANWFAAEHCQLAVSDPWATADAVEHAGELLLGQNTPFSVGNFTLGGPAALPTGGWANRAGGITVEQFLKAGAIGHLTADALRAVADSTIALSEHEGFDAHGNAIRIRQNPQI